MFKIGDIKTLKSGYNVRIKEIIITAEEKIKYHYDFIDFQNFEGCAGESSFLENNEIEIEKICSNFIIQLWNKFNDLPSQHPDEKNDFKNAIHQLQYILMAREARRNNPERFPIVKTGDN